MTDNPIPTRRARLSAALAEATRYTGDRGFPEPGTVPTVADVRADPSYWICGPGRELASNTDCAHGYRLTSSCPNCDAEEVS